MKKRKEKVKPKEIKEVMHEITDIFNKRNFSLIEAMATLHLLLNTFDDVIKENEKNRN